MTAIEATGIGAAVAVAILARRRILLALFVLLMPASWLAQAIVKVHPTLMEWEKLKKSTK